MQKTIIYRKPMGKNLFEESFTIDALFQMGNPLEQLSSLGDFEMFRPALEDVLVKKACRSSAGRPQIDVVLMFKVIFLQRYYGLGVHQIQYQIIDRTSFRQFLGIHTVVEVPDEKTVWACKNKLAGDIEQVWADPKKANEVLGWKALSTTEETLRSAWECQKRLKK